MTIKEVEKKLNISRANIRFYEKEGLLDPKRNDNEYRNYSEEDLDRLEKILLFRKCNISIENIRLIFNGTKSIDEIFKNQISIIENEVKQLEGAITMCKKLSQERTSIDKIDTEKYLNIMENEENKGNKFYNIAEDYLYANEKLYQSIIENKEFKGGDKMKKGIKIGIYIISFILTTLLFALFDYIISGNIDWVDNIIFVSILTCVDLISVKKYIESKTGKKYTKKQNINHIIITIIIMISSIFVYESISYVYNVNKEPNANVLEMSVKKSLIEIAEKEYSKNEDNFYAESHRIIDSEVKKDEIYVYLVTNYGLFEKKENKIESIDSKKTTITLIYKKNKGKDGIYELKEYKENSIPDNLKEKTNVNYDSDYYKDQLYNYSN